MKPGFLKRASEVQAFRVCMENIGAAALGHMRGHVAERRQQEFIELPVRHAVVLDFLSVRALVGHVIRRVRHDEVGLIAVHEARHVRFIGRIAAHHPMLAQQPDIAGLNERLYLFRVDIAVVIPYILIVNPTEQIVDFSRVKAGCVHVIAAELQIVEQIRQGDRLPFADRLIERNVQRFFFLRVFDVNDHAVDLRRAFRRQHLIALMAAHDVARDLVPDDGIHIAELMQAAFDFFIGRVAGLQVFAGIVFRGLQAVDANPLNVHAGIHEIISFSAI